MVLLLLRLDGIRVVVLLLLSCHQMMLGLWNHQLSRVLLLLLLDGCRVRQRQRLHAHVRGGRAGERRRRREVVRVRQGQARGVHLGRSGDACQGGGHGEEVGRAEVDATEGVAGRSRGGGRVR